MYKKILVAYNASKSSCIALDEAIKIAKYNNSELHILSIIPNHAIILAGDPHGIGAYLDSSYDVIKQNLENSIVNYKEYSFIINTDILAGDPADKIIATAYQMKADLVVIGHSTKGVLARWLRGSIGANLLSNLPCSLLIAAAS